MIHIDNVKQKLKEKRASFIESSVGILVACFFLVLIIQVLSVLIYRYQMGTLSDKIAEIVSASGKYDSQVQELVADYLGDTSLKNATVSLEGTEYIGSSNRIQLNSQIKVTITATYNIGFGFAEFSIPLRNVSKSRSDVYWK